MRIIAGEFRGRQLLGPEGQTTRPITDRVKQSVFDILSPRIEGAVVYDLFAGTGSLGLECLSRGCQSAVFFESNRSALSLLKKNIASLTLADRATIVSKDLFEWFAKAPPPDLRADLVFLDPPYRYLNERPNDLRRLGANLAGNHFSPTGLLIFRHDANDSLGLPNFDIADARVYGSMHVDFLAPKPG
jgi:16S rRNA (guanine966-N2)-methyltransferase